MALASQPIAVGLPNRQETELYQGMVSFSPRSLWGGSPMSLKMGSLQNRFYPGASPGQSLGPIAIPDLKRGLSGSYDRATDPAALFNSFRQHQLAASFGLQGDFNMPEEDLCKNYTCCNQHIPDLHALVDHFESHHVLIDDMPLSAQSTSNTYAYSPVTPMYTPAPSTQASPTSTHPTMAEDNSPPAFDADDMDISEPSPSPPPTPASASSTHSHAQTLSAHNPHAPPSAFDPVRIVSPFYRPQHHSSYSSLAGANGPMPSNAFNRYAGYSDYSSCLPGTDPSPSYNVGNIGGLSMSKENGGGCMPTALIFSSSAEPTPISTPVPSRTGSPEEAQASQSQGIYQPHPVPSGTLPLHPSSTSGGAYTQSQPPRPSASASASASTSSAASNPTPTSGNTPIFTKPFRCPKPGCNKSYKQANGLKYHLSHGSCNFAPRDPEVEKLSEAERDKRLRPYVCKVGTECGRRYKNMNGLRYHYQHTGDHGRIGLEMLAQGRHPLPDAPHGTGQASRNPGASSPKSSSPTHTTAPVVPSISISTTTATASAASTPLATPTSASSDFSSLHRASYFPVSSTTGLAPPIVTGVGVGGVHQYSWASIAAAVGKSEDTSANMGI